MMNPDEWEDDGASFDELAAEWENDEIGVDDIDFAELGLEDFA